MEAVKRRQEAEILELCANAQDALAAAKKAYAEDPGEKTRVARRQAMEELHALRRWLREGSRPAVEPGDAAVSDRPPARKKRGRA